MTNLEQFLETGNSDNNNKKIRKDVMSSIQSKFKLQKCYKKTCMDISSNRQKLSDKIIDLIDITNFNTKIGSGLQWQTVKLFGFIPGYSCKYIVQKLVGIKTIQEPLRSLSTITLETKTPFLYICNNKILVNMHNEMTMYKTQTHTFDNEMMFVEDTMATRKGVGLLHGYSIEVTPMSCNYKLSIGLMGGFITPTRQFTKQATIKTMFASLFSSDFKNRFTNMYVKCIAGISTKYLDYNLGFFLLKTKSREDQCRPQSLYVLHELAIDVSMFVNFVTKMLKKSN